MDGYIKPRQAAERLGIHRNTLERLIREGHLRAVILPGMRYRMVAEEEVRRYAESAAVVGETQEAG